MKDYYKEALESLRVLGGRFSAEHPMVAPMLSSQSADPDVERILEGVAFLSGLINRRLDENFPEIATTLLQLIVPELLTPIPSQSLLQFTSLQSVKGIQKMNVGTTFLSRPVENVSCPYTLQNDCDILPIQSCKSTLKTPYPKKAQLCMTINGFAPVINWWSDSLRIYLNDHLARSSQWHMILQRFTKKITVQCGSMQIHLPPSSLQFILPNSSEFHSNKENTLYGATSIRDFFAFPEKFLFLTLRGLNKLKPPQNVSQVEIYFELEGFSTLPELLSSLCAVNVGCVINLFKHESIAFNVTHQQEEYHLIPADDISKQIEIWKVNDVKGIQRGGTIRQYHPYYDFEYWHMDAKSEDGAKVEVANSEQKNIYNLRRGTSPVNGQLEYYLSIMYKEIELLRENETLIASLYCYHHSLPRHLRIGDICKPTDSSPAMATFTNIVHPTSPIPAPQDTNLLWQLFSHIHANLLPLASVEALRHFISLFVPWEENNETLLLFNKRRISSIVDFQIEKDEMLLKGRPISGQKIRVTMNSSDFASVGEMFLFGTLLEQVLNRFVTINTYTKFEIKDVTTGEIISWAPRLGSKCLI